MKTVLITGASSGIGEQFAHIFASKKYRVVLTARNEKKLNALSKQLLQKYQINTLVIPLDLGTPNGPKELYDEIQKQGIEIDVLVNNAGFGSFGYVHEQDISEQLNLIQLNIASLTHLTMLFLPDFVNKERGKILNVASTTSFYPVPLMTVYSASKAFVLSFSESLSTELKGTGVTVTALCPGNTVTGFHERSKTENLKAINNSTMNASMDAKKVAYIGYEALMKGKSHVVPGLHNWTMTKLPRILPRDTVTKVTKKVLEQT
ncbi:SDR family NAD(P)-dependent oxidoreductase [Chengkuizengella axinellae]|uniref:SDR family oxidoreductase n=1 Tax=Chengkuizengella axinellae TaxID=3064388 RepID=A0ABT9IZV5_9BACL|nr:SDR family oxidoreductase [Chengkuizengella sp. 2205SS18-9]MDP5274909.1 SDR family oxidoreductase [Chengkuizengella sp. 2205SS18-9]